MKTVELTDAEFALIARTRDNFIREDRADELAKKTIPLLAASLTYESPADYIDSIFHDAEYACVLADIAIKMRDVVLDAILASDLV